MRRGSSFYAFARRTSLHTNMKRFLSALLAVVLCAALLCPGALAAESPQPLSSGDWLFITLDPGHGGVDGGAQNVVDGKTYSEADIALKIAYAMKAELETYKNVVVSMTRTDAAGSKYTTPSGNVDKRVKFAVENSADLLVSLHLNATETKNAAKGACILVTNGNYLPEIAEQEYAIASNILMHLNRLGITTHDSGDGGLVKRNSSDRTNPNGTVADYYGIVYYGLQEKLPSILIEHCFVSNNSECRQFLSTDEKIAAIGVADALGIVDYYGLEKKDGTEPDAPIILTDYRNHWACESIDAAIAAGWIYGYEDHTFRPEVPLTRAMFVTMLGRLSGADLTQYSGSAFPDVDASSYYAQHVQWAVQAGVIDGFEDGTFRPDENITREQMACIMTRYLRSLNPDIAYSGEPGSYNIQDLNSIGEWALDDVLFCYEAGLLNGRGNVFAPKAGATRAEACTVLIRLADYAEAHSAPAQPEVPTEPETPEQSEVSTEPETPEQSEVSTEPETPEPAAPADGAEAVPEIQ